MPQHNISLLIKQTNMLMHVACIFSRSPFVLSFSKPIQLGNKAPVRLNKSDKDCKLSERGRDPVSKRAAVALATRHLLMKSVPALFSLFTNLVSIYVTRFHKVYMFYFHTCRPSCSAAVRSVNPFRIAPK